VKNMNKMFVFALIAVSAAVAVALPTDSFADADDSISEVPELLETEENAASSTSTCAQLVESPPITVTQDGQKITNKYIKGGDSIYNRAIKDPRARWTPVPGITCNGHKNVEIENVFVEHYAQGSEASAKGSASAATYWQEKVAQYPDLPFEGITHHDAEAVTEELMEEGMKHTSSMPAGAREAPYSYGIYFNKCPGIKIKNVRVTMKDPPTGAFKSFKNFNIYGMNSENIDISDTIVSGGSSGIWLGNSNNAKINNWAAYNVHGPFPRGQCTQFSRSHGGTVTNFICKNQWKYSYPEDAISFWRSANSTIADGVILGNSASTGVGLMFEESSVLKTDTGHASWGKATNIDVQGVGGACFSMYGGTNIVLDNTNCRDNHCVGVAGRKAASGIMYYAGWENPSNFPNCCYSQNGKIKNSKFYNTCRSPWIWAGSETDPETGVKNQEAWTNINIKDPFSGGHLQRQDFQVNPTPIKLELCFKLPDGKEYKANVDEKSAPKANLGLIGDGSVDLDIKNIKVATKNKYGKCTNDATFSCNNQRAPWPARCTWGKCNGCDQCFA